MLPKPEGVEVLVIEVTMGLSPPTAGGVVVDSGLLEGVSVAVGVGSLTGVFVGVGLCVGVGVTVLVGVAIGV